MPGSWPGREGLRQTQDTAFWEPSEPSYPRAREARPFPVWASFVSLRFLLWQGCQIFVILKPTTRVKQWPPVTINYHRPVTFENISRAHSVTPATCTLQLSKHRVTRTHQGQPVVASCSFLSMAHPLTKGTESSLLRDKALSTPKKAGL